MRDSNLLINEKCVNCGSCLGCGYDFIKSLDNGDIDINPGTFVDECVIKKLNDVCPVDAFEYDSKISKKRVLLELRQKLANVKGCLVPVERDFPFLIEEYSIALPESSGSSGFDYSSEKAAERAALSEFDSKMYSQIDNLILKVITAYRVKYVKPYYTRNIDEGSVYAKVNNDINSIIEGICNIVGKEHQHLLSRIEVFPDSEMEWKMLNKGELVSDEMISSVRNEFSYGIDSYTHKWNVDSLEMYDGESIFGNYKYKEKYRYTDLYKAYRELAQDLKDSLKWSKEKLEKRATEVVSWLVDAYNKKLREEINKRVKIVDELLSKMEGKIGAEENACLNTYENIERRVIYSDEKKCIIVNGQEVRETECFVAGNNDVQIFFDGNTLYKKYIDKKNKMIMKEVILPECRYENTLLIGRDNIILIWDGNNAVYTYHIREGKKYLIIQEANDTVCIVGNMVCYSKWDSNRYSSKKLYICDLVGNHKRMLDITGYSEDMIVFRNAREEDGKLKYSKHNIRHPEKSQEVEIAIDRLWL